MLYEGEKFLGQCLSKINGKFRVQCLSMPYGIRSPQVFEKEVDVAYYDKVYKPPIFPWAIELMMKENLLEKHSISTRFLI